MDNIIHTDKVTLHITPKADEKCKHEWPEKDGQTDLYGACTKCKMSFQYYIHAECP